MRLTHLAAAVVLIGLLAGLLGAVDLREPMDRPTRASRP